MFGLEDALYVTYVYESNFISEIFGLIFTIHSIEFNAVQSILRGSNVSTFCNAYILDYFIISYL
jgi:hypothetical protein